MGCHPIRRRIELPFSNVFGSSSIKTFFAMHASARLMLEHKIGGLPVIENGKLIGIITESDIFRVLVKTPELDAQAERLNALSIIKVEQATGD